MGFQQGLSGLNAASKNLDVIGNNVANASTVGFKGAQAQFADVYASSVGGSNQAGIGVRVSTIAQQFTQGNITTTNNSLDMAVSGNGFFRVSDNGSISYTRNGQFQMDKLGYIVTTKGDRLTGFLPNALGAIVATAPADLQISTADLLPKSTAAISAGLNLDSRLAIPTGLTRANVVGNAAAGLTITAAANDVLSVTVDGTASGAVTIPAATYSSFAALAAAVQTAVNGSAALLAAGKSVTVTPGATGFMTMTSATGGTGSSITAPAGSGAINLFGAAPVVTAGAGVFDPTNSTTFNNSTSMTVFDSLGRSHVASLYFVKTNTNSWNSYLTVDGGLVPPAVGAAPPTPLSPMTFSTNGVLTTPAAPVVSVGFTPAGAAPQTLTFDFASTSQFGGIFGVNALSQDGYTSGRLTGFSTGTDGTITGRYSNGQAKTLGQVVLANFSNPQGLQPMGANNWAETSTSGTPLVGAPGSSSLGVLQTSAVEDANVDLTAELVNMITAQRVYQANAQSVKTQDQVLQTIVNLR